MGEGNFSALHKEAEFSAAGIMNRETYKSSSPRENTEEPLVRVEDLSVYFPVRGGMPFARHKVLKAVSHVSLSIPRGQTFGLVGESGCGKSTLANAILGMVRPTEGRIFFRGRDIHSVSQKEFKELRQDMQMIFQDPFSALNPRFDVYSIISEPMLIRGCYTRKEMEERTVMLLEQVGLSAQDLHRYPSDFSGGQRQRIGIARAISLDPAFLVCDEPVSALDMSVHAQILNLLMELQEKRGMTYLFISHNLAVVRDICPSMAVMYLGSIMETGDTEAVFRNPRHPYTQSLLSAVLDMDVDCQKERIILKGEVPSPIDVPPGCLFCKRCPIAGAICEKEAPPLQAVESGHWAACHALHRDLSS